MLVRQRAHAKINLALHITGRRVDGYHELDSIVAFADIADVLTITPATGVSISLSGPFANDLPPEGKNIILTAWQLMAVFAKKRNAPFTPVRFHLEKNLPVAAGIGGGSADAAAALRGLVQYFDLLISLRELNELALQLGADVPICLIQKTSRMRGIGEIIEPIAIKLPPAILLVNPRIPLPTSRVFETLKFEHGQSFGTAIGNLSDIKSWSNDLTVPAIKIVPEIASVIECLISQPNIICSRMSGSGATCFGLTKNLERAEIVATAISQKHPNWWVVATALL
jgi:4-diphosphocytidyl-2-C-methyl-D-erythritol kinase